MKELFVPLHSWSLRCHVTAESDLNSFSSGRNQFCDHFQTQPQSTLKERLDEEEEEEEEKEIQCDEVISFIHRMFLYRLK